MILLMLATGFGLMLVTVAVVVYRLPKIEAWFARRAARKAAR